MTTDRYGIANNAHVNFVNYSMVRRLPVFISEEPCRIVTESLNFCREKKELGTNAFVIMSTHRHAIFFDEAFDNERMQQSLADFGKFTGPSLSDYRAGHLPNWFLETLRASSTADRETSPQLAGDQPTTAVNYPLSRVPSRCFSPWRYSNKKKRQWDRNHHCLTH